MAGFLSYQTKHGRQYASWCRSYRDPNIKDRSRSPKRTVLYLGRVVDKERGIYKSKAKGYVRFDPTTQEFLPPPPDFVPPQEPQPRSPASDDGRPSPNELIVDFGDSYLIHHLCHSSGLMDVLDGTDLKNPDTIKALISFYICNSSSNRHAQEWQRGNFAQYLYPKAKLSSQRITEALAELGTEAKWRQFFTAYLEKVKESNQADLDGIAVDTAGVPNNSHIPYTAIGHHGGSYSKEARILCMTEKKTGRLLFMFYYAGNFIDAHTITHSMQMLREFGLKPNSILIDSGFSTNADLKAFKDNGIEFLTRIGANRTCFKEAVKAYSADLLQSANLVRSGERSVYIKQIKLSIELDPETGETYDGYGYLCRDTQRFVEDQKRAYEEFGRGELTTDALDERLKVAGTFLLLSSKKLEVEELLPSYYTRQGIEQVFDVAKNEVGLLPINVQNEYTFRGHLILTFMATLLFRELQMTLRDTPYSPRSALMTLRSQKIRLFADHGIADLAVKKVNDVYKAAKIAGPSGMVLTLDLAGPFIPKLDGTKQTP